jgi:hypothetical protein
MLDQIVTAEIARQRHENAMRAHGMAVWIVMEDVVEPRRHFSLIRDNEQARACVRTRSRRSPPRNR